MNTLKSTELGALVFAALGLHCCAQAFLAETSRGHFIVWCAGFSLQGLLLLQGTGSRHVDFSSYITWAHSWGSQA